MNCPNCKREMVICAKTECQLAPHWSCQGAEGCGASIPATTDEVLASRWPSDLDETFI